MSEELLYHVFKKNNMFFLIDSNSQLFWNLKIGSENFEKIKDLNKLGFFTRKNNNLEPPKKIEQNDVNHIVINPSTNCNLDCWFCYSKEFRRKNANQLNFSDIRLIFESCIKYKNDINSNTDLSVSLGFTEEITLNFSLFLKVQQYLEKIKNNLNFNIYLFLPSTNLFEVNTGFIKYINEYGYLTVSLDLENDKQKSKLYENLKLFDSKVIKQLIIPFYAGKVKLYDIYKEHQNAFDFISLRPARVKPDSEFPWNKANLKYLKKEISGLFRNLLKREDKEIITFLAKLGPTDFIGRYLEKIITRKKSIFRCPAGRTAFAIDTQLNIYPCSGLIGNSIFCLGKVDKEKERFEISSNSVNNLTDITDCSDCPIRYYCGGPCMDWLYKQIGNLQNSTNPYECSFNKLIFEEIIFFIYKLQKERKELFTRILDIKGLKNNLNYSLDFEDFYQFFTKIV